MQKWNSCATSFSFYQFVFAPKTLWKCCTWDVFMPIIYSIHFNNKDVLCNYIELFCLQKSAWSGSFKQNWYTYLCQCSHTWIRIPWGSILLFSPWRGAWFLPMEMWAISPHPIPLLIYSSHKFFSIHTLPSHFDQVYMDDLKPYIC